MSDFKQLGDQTYIEKSQAAQLDYTFDLTSWCAKSGVTVNDYELTLPTGSTMTLLADERSGDTVSVTVGGGTPENVTRCGELLDGVTCKFITSNGPVGVPLIEYRTMWFLITER
jgi:hypothetical protein